MGRSTKEGLVMTKNLRKNMKNRAWFVAFDGRCPPTQYVMWDNKQPGYYTNFMSGEKFDPNKNTLPIIFNVEDTKWGKLEYILQWDFLHNSSATVLLANPGALQVLEDVAHGQFEALPANIIMPGGHIITEYKLINVLNRIDCINHERSILKPEARRKSYDMYEEDKCYFRPDCLGDKLHFARETTTCTPLVCSSILKDAIKTNKLTGLTFRDGYAGIWFWF
ncbi:conserved hypothetical protein [Alphaproteobacteria bacterium]